MSKRITTRTRTKFSFVQFVKSLFQGKSEQPIVHHYYTSNARVVRNGIEERLSSEKFDALFNQAFGYNVQSSKL